MSVGESIGQRLRRLRLEKGLSQRELAGPGVSYAYVSRIEGGQRRPSLRAIRVLARKLGRSVRRLRPPRRQRTPGEPSPRPATPH